MFELKVEVAKTTRPDLSSEEPYDGALDQFERGMTSRRLDAIFDETRRGLRPLLAAVLDKKRSDPTVDAPHPSLALDNEGWKGSTATQARLAERVAADLGFDFDTGRFDVSTHPFTGGACPSDVRITTRYSDANWLEGFSGTVWTGSEKGDVFSPFEARISSHVVTQFPLISWDERSSLVEVSKSGPFP